MQTSDADFMLPSRVGLVLAGVVALASAVEFTLARIASPVVAVAVDDSRLCIDGRVCCRDCVPGVRSADGSRTGGRVVDAPWW